MKVCVSVLSLLLFLISTPAFAEDQVDPAVMEQVMALAEPGDEHQLLAKLVGEWTMEMKLFMAPGAAAMEAGGTLRNEMILGGRFLQQTGVGTMMGQPIENLTIMGYDRRHEVFTLVGYDTGGTYYITAQGTMQEDGTLLLVGHDDNPPLGSQDYEFRMSFEGENEYSMEIHLSLDGSETFKMVEWTATRN